MLSPTALALAVSLGSAPVIDQVIVFPDRAQVTRHTGVVCGPSVAARFAALPPALDPASLRAATSSGKVIGLRYEEVPTTDAFSKVRAEDEAKLRKLQAQDAELVDALARVQETTRLTDAFGQVTTAAMATETVTAPPMNTPAWQSAFDLDLATRLKAAQERIELDSMRRALAEQIGAVNAALERTREGAERRQTAAEVLVSCTGSAATVELTYRVGGAGWEPAYEARSDLDHRAVELSTFATVVQSTGEDWTHANLILSTAVPRSQATPPTLQTLKVAADERQPERKVLVRRDEEREHAESGHAGTTPVATPAPTMGLNAQSQGLSVQLTVPAPADVSGNGTPVRVFVSQVRLSAEFAYRTAPQLQPFVFRVADVTNTAPFPLLAGPVDAFGRTGFLGRYPLERVAQGARFHLTFGIEDDLKVRRTVLEEIVRDTGLFNGHHRFRYGYRLEVTNYGSTARDVQVMERFPVSELDDVQVDIDPTTTPGFEKRAEDGQIVWTSHLAPQQATKLELHFHVDVPSSYDVAAE